jgi:hypothetical protein
MRQMWNASQRWKKETKYTQTETPLLLTLTAKHLYDTKYSFVLIKISGESLAAHKYNLSKALIVASDKNDM